MITKKSVNRPRISSASPNVEILTAALFIIFAVPFKVVAGDIPPLEQGLGYVHNPDMRRNEVTPVES